MLKAHVTRGYSAGDRRLFGKERFSPTNLFRLLQNKIFFLFSSIHPWEMSEQIMNGL
jgi:hypothetical protein